MIRDASEHDLNALAEGMVRVQSIHADAYPEIYRRFTHTDAVTQLRIELANPIVRVRVAFDSASIIGHYIFAIESTPACLFKHAQHFGHLRQIEVDPKHRRFGVGTRLLDDASQIAARLGLSRLVLDVWAFNDNARSLFCSTGFRPFGSKLELLLNRVPDKA